MNIRQEKFCSEYVISGNATEAAIKAGYSEKTAKSIGQRLLTNVDIAQKITEYKNEANEQTGLELQDIVKKIWHFANNAKTETNQLKALDMLMKHFGGYKEALININAMSESEINLLVQLITDKMYKNEK